VRADFPRIKRLVSGDPLYRQHQEDIQRYNAAVSLNKPLPSLTLYSYTPGEDETIFTLAARLVLSLESLATLNGLDSSASPIAGKTLLVPGMPGIFMREKPANTLERLLSSWRDPEKGQRLTINGERFYFFSGERFHHVERIFFLNAFFRFPLDTQLVSSRYGPRVSPISGRAHFHTGLDLAAPRGSRVYAAREGIVSRKGYNAALGNYIIIAHSGNFETVYGHLDSTEVELNQSVNSGMIIGRVGSTGASTGPHLHFEVREKGESRNPENFLPQRIKP
jgi:murein DD-endopeptidase MepM/ murein hydrolase activator NlpD